MPRASRQSISDFFADEIARWMFFLSGVALLIAAFLLPATANLREVQQLRDQALASEIHHNERIDRYKTFLTAIESKDRVTVELLAQSQLGVIPANREALILPGRPADPLVFELLEPEPQEQTLVIDHSSRLERLTTTPATRVVVIVVGFSASLFGLLLPATDPEAGISPPPRSVLRLQV